MDRNISKLYRQFRKSSPFMMVGHNAELALSAARTLAEWEELEASGKVQIVAEPEEESYFDIYGEPDTEAERKRICNTLDRLGCYWVQSHYMRRDDWEDAGSIGMCVYEDPCDPFENCYVIELMGEAIRQYKEHAYPVCP